MDGLRTFAAALRRWATGPTARALLPLFLICLIGPLGEAIDTALVTELEFDLLAGDFGAELVATLFVSGYQTLMLLLAVAWSVAGIALIANEAPAFMRELVSCAPSKLAKIPIR